ncbi:hypothetical protein ACP4OV_011121 [Aristida adscensionis]
MAAATTTAGAGGGAASAATRRFQAACGALSLCVRAAAAERTRALPAAAMRALLLMPGADVDDNTHEAPPEAGPAPARAQMTIVYGGRVVMLDDVPADKAADLLWLAAAAAAARGGGMPTTTEPQVSAPGDLPVARKASLQRFMEKRKGRAAARGAPYGHGRPDGAARDSDWDEDHVTLAL